MSTDVAKKPKKPKVPVSQLHVNLAKEGYNPLVSVHFKGLRRSDKVELYEKYYERRKR